MAGHDRTSGCRHVTAAICAPDALEPVPFNSQRELTGKTVSKLRVRDGFTDQVETT
jgi:hypothetical protein